MSGTSAFFRRKCRIKSEINTPVSTPSKIIVCEFESLMREQDKILSIRESALPKCFLLMSLFRESIWNVGGCSALYFGSSCFVTDYVVTLLLYTEAGTRTNCFILHLRRKNADVPDIYPTLLDAAGISPSLVFNQNAKAKDRGSWIPFKV